MESINGIEKFIALTAGGVGAVGLGIALAGNFLLLGIAMFLVFVLGALFISNAAEIAAAVFAVEVLIFYMMVGVEQTITRVDSGFALLFFFIAIGILVLRRVS